MRFSLLGWLLVAGLLRGFEIPPVDFDNREYFMLETGADSVSDLIDSHPSWRYEHPARAIDKYHVFSVPKGHPDMETWQKRDSEDQLDDLGPDVKALYLLPPKRLQRRAPVPIDTPRPLFAYGNPFVKRAKDSSQEKVDNACKEFTINDPEFPNQWHIINTQFPGHDVNVLPVWRENITGNGVVTAILDDGLDYDSPDLKDNFCAEGSYDYNDHEDLPTPKLGSDYHGTRCAGEIAAAKGNDFCGVGVAWGSKVSGVRILSGDLTAEDEAAAMVHRLDVNDIYSCSWGPPDNGRAMDKPEKIVREAILKGVQEGRDGKGALYIFASGNGALHGDSCNFDGYTNSIYSITVAAVDHKGLHPPYSEACAAVMVCTYSSGSGEHIHTTDFRNGCTANHGGTSAAAPLAAGLYSLVLEANPNLTWRDVQHLTVLSAVEVDSGNSEWQQTAIPGKRYSYKYGWGKIDANKTVSMAKNDFPLLKPQAWYYTPYLTIDDGTVKRDDSNVFTTSFEISQEVLQKANLEHIEQLITTVHISSTKRGAVSVHLISPHGIDSRLAQARSHDTDKDGFNDWSFSSVAHWGEEPTGTWTLKVTNNEPDKQKVTVKAWQLKLFGESIDPNKAEKFEIDKDYSEINKKEEEPEQPAETVQPEKPSETVQPSTVPTASGKPTHKHKKPPHESHINFEHYALALLIIGFIICILLLKYRKKPGRSRQRDEYEFDIINPEDEDSDFDRNSRLQSDGDGDEESRLGNDDSFDGYYRREREERERLFQTDSEDAALDK